ncbi:alpha/beta hydrolase family protein [Alishewanella sp. d11]|uniref:alpha/beta hydrolase family protein n=1 Tax=Alishewanella sp. d11 TaxID=3414030 RepID=UPI003BF8B843
MKTVKGNFASILLASLLSMLLVTTAVAEQAKTETLSLEAFAMMPMIRAVSVSPDGQQVAIVRATTKEGDYIIEIRQTQNLAATPVTLGADRMLVSTVSWLNNERILVSFRQLYQRRAEKYWVNKIAITDADGKGRWLDPSQDNPTANFRLIDLLLNNPNEILVESAGNVLRYNIYNGRSVTIARGSDRGVQGNFDTDFDGEIRIAEGFNAADNALEVYARLKGDNNWQRIKQISPSKRESYTILGFSNENPNELYVNANLGKNTTGIYLYNLQTKAYSERLFGLESVDTDGLLFDRKGNLLAVSYTDSKPQLYFTDDAEQALYQSIQALFQDKHIQLTSRSLNDGAIVIQTSSAFDPGTFYLLLDKTTLLKIGEKLPLLTPEHLSEVRYINYEARDGRTIYAYLTIPKGTGPHPTIVMPHGGPWVRDTVIFDEWAQLLAHHGYLVIQPNYRGSTGYGLDHWMAGDNNWGLTMQDDLDDAALYLVSAGLADKNKLAMFGWSYGGYAAFVASMRDNNIYQCAIAGAGLSDLNRWNATINENPFLARLQRPTITGVALPRQQTEKVNIPILVVHPSIDSRVPVEHSRMFVRGLEQHNKVHKYVELEDADHFYDTLFYSHKMTFYSTLLDWLGSNCNMH